LITASATSFADLPADVIPDYLSALTAIVIFVSNSSLGGATNKDAPADTAVLPALPKNDESKDLLSLNCVLGC